jgi:mycothiol synthase
MLNIRRFVQRTDEPVWLQVLNAARKGREDWRTITVEELLLEEQRPNFDFGGRFIADLDGKPVGIVHANVDKFREDRKGVIHLAVIPEFRDGKTEQQLLETALRELKTRGMTTAQVQADFREGKRIQLLEGLDFKRVRVFSMMEMDLADVSQNIGENKQVAMRPLHKDADEDIKLVNRLENESFKEHFDYRPDTLEETRHQLLSNPYLKEQKVFFAVLNGESVGYIGVGVDERYNLEKKVKAGEIFTIGVLKRYRRTGIGARLMLHGLKTLSAKGMTKAILGVDDYNPTKAMTLYEKVGFKTKKKDFILEKKL